MDNTELFLFESAFARDTYQRTIGTPTAGLVRCVFNGVTAEEFDAVTPLRRHRRRLCRWVQTHQGGRPSDRRSGRLRARGRPVTLTLRGDGEELNALKAQVAKFGLTEAVRFIGHVKARFGFSKGKLLVVPCAAIRCPMS